MGRYLLYINTTIRAVKYWLKLCKLPNDRLPKQAYHMLISSNVTGRVTWAEGVKQSLYQLGFGYVWNNCGTSNERGFLNCLKQRLKDCFQQKWHGKSSDSDRVLTYRSFMKSLEAEQCINELKIKKFRDTLIRFRLGINELHVNRRYERDRSLNCPFCLNSVENERHFL